MSPTRNRGATDRIKQKVSRVLRYAGAAVKDFRHVASLLPSTHFSARAIVRHLPKQARVVLEYGPGMGAITRSLLHALPAQATLTCIEVNPEFVQSLKALKDPRLAVRQGSVLSVLPKLQKEGIQSVDAVISGIPFSLIPEAQRERIVAETRSVLSASGCCIIYQNSLLLRPLLRKYFCTVSTHFELRNLFPYFIMVARVSP